MQGSIFAFKEMHSHSPSFPTMPSSYPLADPSHSLLHSSQTPSVHVPKPKSEAPQLFAQSSSQPLFCQESGSQPGEATPHYPTPMTLFARSTISSMTLSSDLFMISLR